jgi:hypothetical protein
LAVGSRALINRMLSPRSAWITTMSVALGESHKLIQQLRKDFEGALPR